MIDEWPCEWPVLHLNYTKRRILDSDCSQVIILGSNIHISLLQLYWNRLNVITHFYINWHYAHFTLITLACVKSNVVCYATSNLSLKILFSTIPAEDTHAVMSLALSDTDITNRIFRVMQRWWGNHNKRLLLQFLPLVKIIEKDKLTIKDEQENKFIGRSEIILLVIVREELKK